MGRSPEGVRGGVAVVRRGGGDGVGGEVVRRRRAERRRRPGRLVEPEVGGGVAGRRGEALRRHGRCQPWGEGYGDGIHAAASAPHAQSPTGKVVRDGGELVREGVVRREAMAAEVDGRVDLWVVPPRGVLRRGDVQWRDRPRRRPGHVARRRQRREVERVGGVRRRRGTGGGGGARAAARAVRNPPSFH